MMSIQDKVLFLAIVVGIIVMLYKSIKNKKKIVELSENQKEILKSKKLKLCYERIPIISIIILFVLIILLVCSKNENKLKYAMSLMFVTVAVMAVPSSYRDNILYFKKEIDRKYGVINEKDETFVPEKIEETMRQLSCKNELSEEEKNEYIKMKQYLEIWACVDSYLKEESMIIHYGRASMGSKFSHI